ncbi:TPA: CPBP family intramembrane metalloprotease, partial [Bacillus cereus]|nr:CPBP family intramembrane metalloprotease [Bacillus cereus]
METKILETEKNIASKSLLAFSLLITTGIVYQIFAVYLGGNLPQLLGILIEALWNLVLCGIIGYYFLGKISLEQFKHFRFKTLLWGVPLTIIVGMGSSLIFSYIFEPATKNSVAEVISIY